MRQKSLPCPRHDEDLREPLVWRQGSQVSMRVARPQGLVLGVFPEAGLPIRGPRATECMTIGALGRGAKEPGACRLGLRKRQAIWGGVRPV